MSCLQLVADAGSVVMMTNAEKQRLQQLLEEERDDDNDEVFFICVWIFHKACLIQGVGYEVMGKS